MRFELETTGIDHAARNIYGAGDRSSNLRPAFKRIADEWIASERRQWAFGKGWAPLAHSTLARKRRQGLSMRPLHATGALERALTIKRQPGQTIRLSKQSMVVGLKPNGKVFYGKFHQKGRGVPQRKVVVFDKQAERRAGPIMRDYIVEGSRTTIA